MPETPAPAGTTAPASPGVTLRLKFTPGQVLTYQVTMNMNRAGSLSGMPMNMASDTGMTMVETVQQVDSAGNATVLAQIDNPTMTMTMNGQPAPLPPNATDSLKRGYTEVLSPTGQMLSMKSNAPASGPGDSAGSPAMPGVSGLFSPSQLSGFSMLPDHPVKVGDIWRNSTTAGPMGLQMYMKMALVDVSGAPGSQIATITVKNHADLKPNASSPIPLSGQLDGTGRTIFDVGQGELAHGTANMTFDSTKSDTASPGATGMKIHMTMSYRMDLVPGG